MFYKQKLIKWLEDNNGQSVHRFEVDKNGPLDDGQQIAAARVFAEKLRAQLGNDAPEISVTQTYNKVVISLEMATVSS